MEQGGPQTLEELLSSIKITSEMSYDCVSNGRGDEALLHLGMQSVYIERLKVLLGDAEGGSVTVTQGPSEGEQESSFMNATLQRVGDQVAFSVSTTISVPGDYAKKGVGAVSTYIEGVLSNAHRAAPALSFNVQVGLCDGAGEIGDEC